MKLSNQSLSSFCSQLNRLIHAGIPVSEGLLMMKDSLPEGESAQYLQTVYDRMQTGEGLSESLAACGGFSEYALQMIKIGEETGRLEQVTQSLSVYYQKQDELSRSIRSAVFYPCMMAVMMAAVVLVLIIRIFPVFEQVFNSLGTEMTGLSRGILQLGQLLGSYALVFIVILAAAAAVLIAGRRRWFVRTALNRQLAASRLADALSMTISSGLDTDRCMELSQPLVTQPELAEKVRTCRSYMDQGDNLGAALQKAEIFDRMSANMITIGIKTGCLETVMQEISDRYSGEVQERIEQRVSVIEPTLVAVMSVLVGMILLSVMLPLMSVLSSIG